MAPEVDEVRQRSESAAAVGRHLVREGRARRQDFRVEGLVDGRPVRATRTGGRLLVDRALRERVGLLIGMGERFTYPDLGRDFAASTTGPAVVVALTCARACDRVRVIDLTGVASARVAV